MNIHAATRKLNRLRRVAQHIDRHLFEPLRLADLAELAAMSRFHFERVFAGYAGETPLARVRRLRLARAKQQLEQGSVGSVLTLALDCGYDSHEGFTRAFKQQFGLSPSCVPVQPATGLSFTVSRLPAHEIQYLDFQGRMDEAWLSFDELRARALAQGIARERRKGWAVHLEGEAHTWAAPHAAVLRAALLSAPLGMQVPGLQRGRLPGGTYAVFELQGSHDAPSREQIDGALALQGEWRVVDGPVLRRFDNPMYLPADHERRAAFHVPVARR
jgi:AraC family transcriptional regulator